ncbi:N-lysine methyltransferase KMT5A-A-like [Anoplophora glabripennis]|uniref:N-lysine methyltransferase KMT5A-A-like n=1 Tax=Anoplophora glabripennis TaxID=217634 RepID=UPI0008747265|nr:N-lysine methyltransferase KMT5A-A-like [Anoplophora glabripennis]
MVRALFKQKPNRRNTLHRKTLENLNHKVTEYFSVRKSDRRTKRELQEEKRLLLEYALKKGIEEGLEVRYINGKGRGVFASKNFLRGEFVVEYSGELIDVNEASRREKVYEEDESTGCYMYYFKHNEQQYCVDATAESGKLGRLINHSRNGNLVTRTVLVDGKPRLALLARADIREGEELLYDYGDRSKEALEHHPWLAL